MRSPPPPRVLADWLTPLVLYGVVFPVVTLLLVFAESVEFGISFSALSLAPLVLSILYWVGRFGDAGGSSAATGNIEFGTGTPKTIVNYDLADRSGTERITSTHGLGMSAYSMYFLGLLLASLLVFAGVVS